MSFFVRIRSYEQQQKAMPAGLAAVSGIACSRPDLRCCEPIKQMALWATVGEGSLRGAAAELWQARASLQVRSIMRRDYLNYVDLRAVRKRVGGDEPAWVLPSSRPGLSKSANSMQDVRWPARRAHNSSSSRGWARRPDRKTILRASWAPAARYTGYCG